MIHHGRWEYFEHVVKALFRDGFPLDRTILPLAFVHAKGVNRHSLDIRVFGLTLLQSFTVDGCSAYFGVNHVNDDVSQDGNTFTGFRMTLCLYHIHSFL